MIRLKLRVSAIEHSCAHLSEREPPHDPIFCAGIKDFIAASEGVNLRETLRERLTTGNAKQVICVDRPAKQIGLLQKKRCQCDV